MRILLLGGTGTLSYDVLGASLRAGHAVSIINRGNNNDGVDPAVTIYRADLCHGASVTAALGGATFDVVVDFFSRSAADIECLFPRLAVGCRQYVFISSACVYKRSAASADAITETTAKPNPGWAYNTAKYAAEQALVTQAGRCAGVSYTIVRPYITYNVRRVPFGLAPAHRYHRTLIERARSGKPLFVWDDGATVCTLTYSADFARALTGLFLNPRAMNEDYNITGDHTCTWRDMLDALYRCLGVSPNIVSLTSQQIVRALPEYRGELLGDRSLHAVFDNSKVKAAVPGLSLDTPLDEGLSRVVEHYDRSDDYQYDYRYEGRIDRMLARYGVSGLRYEPYPHATAVDRRLYLAYRHLPLGWARRVEPYLK